MGEGRPNRKRCKIESHGGGGKGDFLSRRRRVNYKLSQCLDKTLEGMGTYWMGNMRTYEH